MVRSRELHPPPTLSPAGRSGWHRPNDVPNLSSRFSKSSIRARAQPEGPVTGVHGVQVDLVVAVRNHLAGPDVGHVAQGVPPERDLRILGLEVDAVLEEVVRHLRVSRGPLAADRLAPVPQIRGPDESLTPRGGEFAFLVPRLQSAEIRGLVLDEPRRIDPEVFHIRQAVAPGVVGQRAVVGRHLFQSDPDTAHEPARHAMKMERIRVSGLLGAIAEAIDVGRLAGLPVHIAHLKALGPSVHGQSQAIIALVEAARAEGLQVTADQYPWLASGTRLSNALVPRRIMTGGAEGLRTLLAQRDTVESIQEEMLENLRRRGGADALLITGRSDHQGQTLAEVARELDIAPTMAAVDIVRSGDPAVASFMMDADDVRRLMVQEWVVTSSDGSRGHPRKFASFPEKYSRYVQGEKLIDLTTFVHRSTGATAEILNMCNRGLLRAGYKADIVIFDPEGYAPKATYEQPEELAVGVEYLFVNGVAAIDEAQLAAAGSGRVLDAQACRSAR